MRGNQQPTSMMCEVFILAPTDLVGEHEIPANGPLAASLTQHGGKQSDCASLLGVVVGVRLVGGVELMAKGTHCEVGQQLRGR